MATIRPIPKAVHSSMRSGTVLFDLTRVVEELIYNSLDASATKVSVCVGIRTCYVEVMDDGHATSKMKSLADMDALSTSFGFRGEALGSVSDISLLEIITKTHGMPNGYRKIIKGCKCLYLGVDDSRQDTGTAVTVRDLYYNQPVRRKHMQNSPSKVLHSVKKCVLRIALMHPKLSFTVIDIESEEELFSTQSSTSPLPLLIKEFGAETCENLLELNIADGMFQLSGHVSRPQDTYSPKALQFIYSSTVRKRNRAQMNPTYILNLTCPRSLYDLSFEPSHTSVEFKEWSYLLTFIERTILKFWSKKLRGDKSRSVPAYEEGDPLIPLEKGDSLIPFEEDSRTKHHALEDIGWIANAKSLSPGVLEVSIDSGMKWRDTCQISAIEQSRNLHHERKSHDLQDILDVSSDILHFSADLLVPKCIDKDCLMDAKVLQQVDKKFIPIVGRGIMAVIDQHAADERIRLEELRNKVLSGEVKETTYLDEEQMTELPEVGYQLLHKPSRISSTADTDGSSTIPPAIIRILNSKACRGAIMFGDVLLPSECSLLVEELKNTSLCFQCAHGRPTTVPLQNLSSRFFLRLPKMGGSWRKLKKSRSKVQVGLPRKNPHIFKPAFCLPPKLRTLIDPLGTKWDEKGSVIANYKSFGVVSNPTLLSLT
ncbi:unnamed protein product [Rhodiola kirilowii]